MIMLAIIQIWAHLRAIATAWLHSLTVNIGVGGLIFAHHFHHQMSSCHFPHETGEYDPAAEPVRPIVVKKVSSSTEKQIRHSDGNKVTSQDQATAQQLKRSSSGSQHQTEAALAQQGSTASRDSKSSLKRAAISQTPSGMGIVMPGAVGGSGAMILRDNPAMAMALAQSVPPGQMQGG